MNTTKIKYINVSVIEQKALSLMEVSLAQDGFFYLKEKYGPHKFCKKYHLLFSELCNEVCMSRNVSTDRFPASSTACHGAFKWHALGSGHLSPRWFVCVLYRFPMVHVLLPHSCLICIHSGAKLRSWYFDFAAPTLYVVGKHKTCPTRRLSEGLALIRFLYYINSVKKVTCCFEPQAQNCVHVSS